jgi:hypothetical protein
MTDAKINLNSLSLKIVDETVTVAEKKKWRECKLESVLSDFTPASCPLLNTDTSVFT